MVILKEKKLSSLLNIVTPLHKQAKRDYLGRMQDEKVHCMNVAKEYEKDYWDGNRRYGYGGYRYDGRWKVVAEKLIEEYGLSGNAKILDVGCGKGFLLYEMQQLLPGAELVGFDISKHGLADAKEEIRGCLREQRAEETYPFKDDYFDLVYSITTFHNLEIFNLKRPFRKSNVLERINTLWWKAIVMKKSCSIFNVGL